MNKSVKIFLFESFKHPGYWEGLIYLHEQISRTTDDRVEVIARTKEMAEVLAWQKYADKLRSKVDEPKTVTITSVAI